MFERNAYFVRTKPQLKLSKNHNKLLSIVLKRLTATTLIAAFEEIKKCSNNHKKKLERLEKICCVNQSVCVFFAWQKLTENCKLTKKKERVIKDVFILAHRMKEYVIKDAFFRLRSYGSHVNKSAFVLLEKSKKNIMFQLLKRLITKNKIQAWHKLKNNEKTTKEHRRILTINVITKGAIRRNLLYSWSKLSNYGTKKSTVEPTADISGKIEDLNLQLEDYKIQVENKTENIIRLQEELTELKQSSFMQTNQNNSMLFNNSFQTRTNRNRNKSNSNSLEKDKEPSDGGSFLRDNSYGSILGHSFISYKSRGSNAGSKAEECGCHGCGYRDKYEKHKATSDTLKKQLDIIKTELEFTKDMNEHLENEIRNHLGDDEREKKIELLRNELRESQKERESLKEKILKYEKYVTKLKMEFKTKIEEIYRRVKKNA